LLPAWRKSEDYRKDCEQKAEEIATLKEELKGRAVNGTPDLDASFWKAKYETLLSQLNRR